MDNDNDVDDSDDFDPNDDNNESPMMWITKAIEIFSGDDWIVKLNQLADMHPAAIARLKIGIKDLGMTLSKQHQAELDRLEKKSKNP